jgi:hypothetical protein
MNSYLVYRASFYLMLTVATMAFSADWIETPFLRLYPLLTGVAAGIAFFTVDRARQWALPRSLANILALGSLLALYYEYKFDETQLIRSLGHWLVYLELILFFLPKTAEDDWFLFTLGLMQVLIGAVINQTDQIAAWLFVWAMLAIWVLGQFFLQREASRFRALANAAMVGPPATVQAPDAYRGLFDFPYALSTLHVLATTLALGGLIFLMLPRKAGATRAQTNSATPKHLTGFDEEVQLGQLGEILENDSVVMTVELTDENGKTIQLDEEPLFRGATMLGYDSGRWKRQNQRPTQTVASFARNRGRSRARIIQRIKLEPNDSATLFAIRPILDAEARLHPYLNPLDGTLFRSDANRSGAFDYVITSDPDTAGLQPGESPPSPFRIDLLREISPKLKDRLKAIAEPVVKNIDPKDKDATRLRARAIERYLRDSGIFSYSLLMETKDPTIDPVEDFLVNRKEGHCEYFASALALLLRSIDIPTRMVNGFKGGDWNELTQTMNVRQKHAHSWVEAYLGMGPENAPIWITLDPTPANERQRSIAEVGGVAGNFRPFTDVLRHLWVFYIVGYDGERQNRVLYAPMREIMRLVMEKYIQIGKWIRRWFALLFHFPSVSAFISIRGFVVSFVVLTLLAGAGYVSRQIGIRFLRWLRGPQADMTSLTAGILFYRRLAQLLMHYNLERTPAETQSEFAGRASKFLATKGLLADGLAEVPQQVVEAFYRVRFGHLELEPASLDELDRRLDALENRLNSA